MLKFLFFIVGTAGLWAQSIADDDRLRFISKLEKRGHYACHGTDRFTELTEGLLFYFSPERAILITENKKAKWIKNPKDFEGNIEAIEAESHYEFANLNASEAWIACVPAAAPFHNVVLSDGSTIPLGARD